MNGKREKRFFGAAQAQLEALICIAFFIAMLGALLHSLGQAKQAADAAGEALQAKSNALLCCAAVDSTYSNSAAGLLDEELHCTAESGMMLSSAGEKTKEADCIAPGIKTAQNSGKTRIEVTLNEHYR
ncbi:MAG: hypothetical protein NTW59_01045 [Candidatus Diapherotrites archaeon]|nr:hypothetical protein [Candidatus Diapherotrites archaeon]